MKHTISLFAFILTIGAVTGCASTNDAGNASTAVDSRKAVYRAREALEAGDADKSIAELTAVIQANPKDKTALFYRARAWRAKGDYDRAIADYDAVIRLNPTASNYYNRGNAWRSKGELDRAISDYETTIEMDINHKDVFIVRGIARFYKNQYAAAMSDFSRAMELRPDTVMPMVWLYLAQRRAGKANAGAELLKNAGHLDPKNWPFPIIALFGEKNDPQAVLAAAKNPDSGIEEDQMCVANFYLGQWHLLQGRKAQAVELLRKASEMCAQNTYERSSASLELRRLP